MPSRERRRTIHQAPMGSGMETLVFAHEVEHFVQSGDTIVSTDTKQGDTVIKNYVTENDPARLQGFDQTLRDKIAEHYKALCAQYGKQFFPNQRILPMPINTNHLHPEPQFLLVQERVTPAATADFMRYEPEKLPDNTRALAAELLAKRKASYTHYLEQPDDRTNRHLDFFGKSNLMVTATGELKFVDTSPKYADYSKVVYPVPFVLGTTALFESVLGTDLRALLQDPFYSALVTQPKCAPLQQLVTNPKKFRQKLRELIISGALVVGGVKANQTVG